MPQRRYISEVLVYAREDNRDDSRYYIVTVGDEPDVTRNKACRSPGIGPYDMVHTWDCEFAGKYVGIYKNSPSLEGDAQHITVREIEAY